MNLLVVLIPRVAELELADLAGNARFMKIAALPLSGRTKPHLRMSDN
jgi:hypothetical protein